MPQCDKPTPSVAVVLGTRPEIIKMAAVVRELGDRAWVIHTGQHYDENLSDTFYDEAGIGRPATVLDGVGGLPRGAQIGAMLTQLDSLFASRRPAAVIVQGDTNSTNAGAQAASYQGIPLVHVEAGLRSHDRAMPEELNRLLVGALADLHCAATVANAENLAREGVDPTRVVVTGNTIVQAVGAALARRSDHAIPLPARYVLATVHRPENTDEPAALEAVLTELGGLGLPVIAPLHPRTVAAVRRHRLARLLAPLTVVDPVDHHTFLHLAARAVLLISDSGGVQEECTVLKKPLVVVRRSTERPESIAAGFAHLASPGPEIGSCARALLADPGLAARLRATPSPYGDGGAALRICDATRQLLARGRVVGASRPQAPQVCPASAA